MKRYILFVFLLLMFGTLHAQMVTGVWRGTMTKGRGLSAKSMKVELKLIKKADSLLGTCYYYVNPKMYMRYSVIGYFDAVSNSVHWQDHRFLASKPEHKATDPDVVTTPMKSTTDFNCPNPNATMKLDGYSEIGEGELFDTHLTKVPKSLFPDEWDNVIDGYTVGMADPDIIDSVWAIASVPHSDPLLAVKEQAAKERAASEEKAKQESVAKAKAEADEKARQESVAKAKAEADEKAKQETIAKEKREAEEKTKRDAIARAEAEEKARQEAIAKEKREADEKAKREAVAKAEAEEKAKVEAAAKAKTEADEKARLEATAKAKAEAEEKARQDAIAKSKAEADAKAKQEEMAKAKAVADEKARQDAIVAKAKAMEEKAKQDAIAKADAEAKAREDARAKAKAAEEKAKLQPNVANNTKTPANTPVASGARAATTAAILTQPEKQDPEAVKKFTTRRKVQQGEIPVQGDSIELHFYDNAEVDGDSISLFVNGRLLFNHVKLSTLPFVFKLGVKDLPNNSELAMVAENLGAIPPNTALMLAFMNGERLSFRLESTEQSSGTIRLVKRE